MNNTQRATLIVSLTCTALIFGCGESTSTSESTSDAAANTDAGTISQSVAEVEGAVVESPGRTAGVVIANSTEATQEAFLVANSFEKLTATVVSVDLETRSVVLRDADGFEDTLVVGEEAQNLDQVQAGDTVTMEVLKQISAYLIKDASVPLGESEVATQMRAKKGEMPYASKIQGTVSVYEVNSIDQENNMFTLKDADGTVAEFTAQNPANLAKASVGDRVLVDSSTINAVKVERGQ